MSKKGIARDGNDGVVSAKAWPSLDTSNPTYIILEKDGLEVSAGVVFYFQPAHTISNTRQIC